MIDKINEKTNELRRKHGGSKVTATAHAIARLIAEEVSEVTGKELDFIVDQAIEIAGICRIRAGQATQYPSDIEKLMSDVRVKVLNERE